MARRATPRAQRNANMNDERDPTSGDDSRSDDDAEQLPPALLGELRSLYDVTPRVPAAIDDAVVAGARLRMRRHARRWRWFPVAAAVVLVAVVLAPALIPRRELSGDLTRDGRVDIVDALALARRVESGEPLDRRWDVSGDGAVDRRDVDAIAARAVSLEARRREGGR